MTKSIYLIILILLATYLPAAEISHWNLNDASDDLIAQDSLSISSNAEIIGNGVNFQQEGTLSSTGTVDPLIKIFVWESRISLLALHTASTMAPDQQFTEKLKKEFIENKQANRLLKRAAGIAIKKQQRDTK